MALLTIVLATLWLAWREWQWSQERASLIDRLMAKDFKEYDQAQRAREMVAGMKNALKPPLPAPSDEDMYRDELHRNADKLAKKAFEEIKPPEDIGLN